MAHGNSISINITTEDARLLDTIVAAVPLVNRHAIARLSYRLGVRQLADDPARAIELLRDQPVRVMVAGRRRAPAPDVEPPAAATETSPVPATTPATTPMLTSSDEALAEIGLGPEEDSADDR